MNQKTKLIIFGISGLLFFLVVIFVVSLARYEPPAVLEQKTETVPFAQINVSTKESESVSISPSTLSVQVVDEQRHIISGAVCELSNHDNGGYSKEIATTTDDGVCNFILSKTKKYGDVNIVTSNKQQESTLIHREMTTAGELMLIIVVKEGNRGGVSINGKVLAITVVDEEGRPVPDALCTMSYRVFDEDTFRGVTKNRKTDTQGGCNFINRGVDKIATISAESFLLKKKSENTEYVSKGLDVEDAKLVLNISSSLVPSGTKTGNPTQKACIDSDGGQNYFTKGTATGIVRCVVGGKPTECPGGIVPRTDVCTIGSPQTNGSTAYVNEYFCGEDGRIASELGPCPNGCVDGACKK